MYVGIFYKLSIKILVNVSVIFTMHLFIHTLYGIELYANTYYSYLDKLVKTK